MSVPEALYVAGYVLQIVSYVLAIEKVSRKGNVLGLSCDYISYSWLWFMSNVYFGGNYLASTYVVFQYANRYPEYPTFYTSKLVFFLDCLGLAATSCLMYQIFRKYRSTRKGNEASGMLFYFVIALILTGLVWLLWNYARGQETLNELDIANYFWLFLGRVSNNLSLGVVGLANVGKSTFFQAITKSTLGNPANYPYATIDPSMSLIVVESPKLDHLQKLYGSAKKVPTSMTIYDIAGLTRNAALGEGLGNKFLADIRQVDGVFHVVRGFRDDEITHIEHNVDPVRDMTIVTDELILKDLDYIEIGLEQAQKALKKPQADKGKIQFEIDTLNKLLDLLYLGRKVSTAEWSNEEIDIINPLNLLTAKPTVVLLNVNEADYQNDTNEFKEAVQGWIQENCPEDELMLFSAAYETQLNEKRDNVEELEAYMAEHGHKGSAMSGIVDKMRSALRLVSFYTCGPKEAHQWTVREGSLAPEAAGTIHTDLQKTFISAQVYKWKDLQDEQPPLDEAGLKSKGKQHRQGKAYVIEDGDVLVVKAAGGKAR
ncbi:GTP-binding protein YchF [Candidozyma pseudohaemuli]|uniref:Obg-like ATPase homolog n=1 Tax=Candidozyma pseudohaemuli TaxID=418784 RepID=A0A2P7YUY3_9ASCO|nr:GTP-binding protein YchF [[Candida] pseudohaemulonii]PSK39777.1 GTP-binding protein YchF [[Candida] pseudohaemulonii]